ncbi:hypothetical protein [Actinacidiphila bryophytorum]|uniref:hypothetical protein n=1 Tax=Actinacidiphila bryophytorum TaxID=1436133 RepID=UPI002176ED6F|nr:hypothetical protein [Actinacidiphila bryophytorum]UWE12473.1 hypothetical protein NYE86_29825 [Actinacidiphila bryophytorum]
MFFTVIPAEGGIADGDGEADAIPVMAICVAATAPHTAASAPMRPFADLMNSKRKSYPFHSN